MLALQFPGDLGDQPHGVGLAAADANVPGDPLFRLVEFPFCLFHQLHDLAGPFAEQDAVFCQSDFAVPPGEQLFPQLFLQIHQLAGQGGLGQMQVFGSPGDALFPGHRQKIAQHTQLHRVSPFLSPSYHREPCFSSIKNHSI